MSAPFFELGAFGSEAALVAAVAIGIAFGFALERAGLGDARKLAGQFYLTDLTVFKVMFSAIVTAMLGAFWLGRLGVLDLSRVYVPETYLLPQLVGGLLFGAGFVLAGLCPGTSCVAAATGRGDGLLVMLGMFAGVLVTGLAFESLSRFYESTARGALTLPSLLQVPYGVVVCAVVAMALIAFWIAESRLLSSRASSEGPGWAGTRGTRFGVPTRPGPSLDARDDKTGRRMLASMAVVGGLLAMGGSPQQGNDVARLASVVAREEDHVTALELAQWIRDHKKGLRILDLRSAAEFGEYHIPRSERMPIETLVSTTFGPTETLVLISDGGAHAAQGWVLLQSLGYAQVYFLRGGVGEWLDEIMSPAKPSDLTRYFGGMPRTGTQGDDASAIRRRGC